MIVSRRGLLVACLLFSAISAATFACTDAPQGAPEAEDESLNAFFDAVFERRVADSPEFQSRLGRKTDSLGEWTDRSDAFAAAQIEKDKADLARLRADFDYESLSGQALGYKMGMTQILVLRDRAQAALGDRFDIRDFHDAVIGAGALPLPILEQQVDRYISDARASAFLPAADRRTRLHHPYGSVAGAALLDVAVAFEEPRG